MNVTLAILSMGEKKYGSKNWAFRPGTFMKWQKQWSWDQHFMGYLFHLHKLDQDRVSVISWSGYQRRDGLQHQVRDENELDKFVDLHFFGPNTNLTTQKARIVRLTKLVFANDVKKQNGIISCIQYIANVLSSNITLLPMTIGR